MPRKRKYDYQKDYPVKTAIYVKIPVEIKDELENDGYTGAKMSELVERFLIDFAEKNRKKD